MPAAPADGAGPATNMHAEPTVAATATAARGKDEHTARAPVECCLTLPFAPLCAWNQISSGNVTFSGYGSEGRPTELSDG